MAGVIYIYLLAAGRLTAGARAKPCASLYTRRRLFLMRDERCGARARVIYIYLPLVSGALFIRVKHSQRMSFALVSVTSSRLPPSRPSVD
jgi:hypothetical protein